MEQNGLPQISSKIEGLTVGCAQDARTMHKVSTCVNRHPFMTAPFMAEMSQEYHETVGAGGCLPGSLSASWSGREWLHNNSPSRMSGLEVGTSDRNPSTLQSCTLSDTPASTASPTIRRKLSRSWATEESYDSTSSNAEVTSESVHMRTSAAATVRTHAQSQINRRIAGLRIE
eukprot:652315-Prorocentrum_minimum.AAC.1